MGIFDSPFKNVLAKSPPDFRAAIELLEPALLSELQRRDVPRSGFDPFRTVIYGRLALGLLQLYPGWGEAEFRYIFSVTANAEKIFPKLYAKYLPSLTRQSWELVCSQYGDEEERVTASDDLDRALLRATNLPIWNQTR